MNAKSKKILKAFFLSTLFALSIRLFLIEDYRITSNSMAPTLFKGDLVLVYKAAFNLRLPYSNFELLRTGTPQRSDIVAFSLPDEPSQAFIKRIIAVGGDKVEIKEGELWINSTKLEYQTIGSAQDQFQEEFPSGKRNLVSLNKESLKNYGPIDIPSGHFFVLGDNRNESIDSRIWGPLPVSCLKGKLAWTWFSFANQI